MTIISLKLEKNGNSSELYLNLSRESLSRIEILGRVRGNRTNKSSQINPCDHDHKFGGDVALDSVFEGTLSDDIKSLKL